MNNTILDVNNLAYGIGWEIEIIPPLILEPPSELTDKVYFKESSLPSSNVEVLEHLIYNRRTKIIKSMFNIDNISISVRGDSNYKIYRFFDEWKELRIDKSKDLYFDIGLLRYPDEYYGSIKFTVTSNGNKILTVELIEAYPISIPDIRLLSTVDLVEYDIPMTFSKVNKIWY